MREQGRSKTGIASLHHVKLSPMSPPDPTGERQEHLGAIVSFAGAGQRRRLFRGPDILTIKWATGDLPEECRILLNTQLMFLKKEKDPTTKQFDDDEWIRLLTEAREVTTDIPEDGVTHDQQDVDPKKVRTIQTGEFLRKHVSRRQPSRQRCGRSEWALQVALWPWPSSISSLKAGSLGGPLARVKVDEKNCFGMIEWKAVREAASRFSQKHTAAATWKHRSLSHVESEGLPPMPKDRVAEREDVDGP